MYLCHSTLKYGFIQVSTLGTHGKNYLVHISLRLEFTQFIPLSIVSESGTLSFLFNPLKVIAVLLLGFSRFLKLFTAKFLHSNAIVFDYCSNYANSCDAQTGCCYL
jgi:hypothetical protein